MSIREIDRTAKMDRATRQESARKASTAHAHSWKKFSKRFSRHLNEKADRIEANGNPRRAESFRAFWSKFGQ